MVTYLVILICIWWILFFISLPIAIEKDKNIQKGNADSAPKEAHLKKKIIIVTIIAIILAYFAKIYLDEFMVSTILQNPS